MSVCSLRRWYHERLQGHSAVLIRFVLPCLAMSLLAGTSLLPAEEFVRPFLVAGDADTEAWSRAANDNEQITGFDSSSADPAQESPFLHTSHRQAGSAHQPLPEGFDNFSEPGPGAYSVEGSPLSEYPEAGPWIADPEAEPLCTPAPPNPATGGRPGGPPSFRTDLQWTYTPGQGDDLGWTDFDLRLLPGFPGAKPFTYGALPGFGARVLDGPDQTDLPGALYDVSIDVTAMAVLNDRWRFIGGVTPSFFTDFENTSSDAFRIPGRLLALWSARPGLSIALGAVFLDREDVSWLPAAGLVWSPRDDMKVDLMFPRPRFSYRLGPSGDVERWVWVGGEFGGGSWAIRRASGADDVVTYSALRLLVGYELRNKRGLSPRFEAGYIFNRSIEYNSGLGDYDPDGAAVLRAGLAF